MTAPVRIQLSRAKGFNLQAASRAINGLECVKVDRTTRWGNPFRRDVAGVKDNASAVDFYRAMLCLGDVIGAGPTVQQQRVYREYANNQLWRLRGRNLACWCRLCPAHKAGKPFGLHCDDCAPCHSDALGLLANSHGAR